MKRLVLAALFIIGATLTTLSAAANERRVVVIILPGLDPARITAEDTPILDQMRRHGTYFSNHHALYPTTANANIAALATGAYPATNGILTDNEYLHDIEPLKAVSTSDTKTIQIADLQTQGHYLKVPTIAEILHARTPPDYTDCAGTDITTLLTDRAERKNLSTGRVLATGCTLPETTIDDIIRALGIYPSVTSGNKTARDTWTTGALTDILWEDTLPRFTLLHLAEPAYTSILDGPASYATDETLPLSDGKVGMILAALQKRNQLADTDIFVLSTHGITTTSKQVDLAADLHHLGIEARTDLDAGAAPGSILLVTNGSGASIYITAHDAAATAQTIAALRKLDYVGPLFTRAKTPGAFSLDQIHADTPDAPDILLSYRWKAANNRTEAPSSDPGKGATGNLAPQALDTFMIALGPDFAPGKTDTLPTGNLDLAPTILWILGVEPPKNMNGRVLFEALTQGGNVPSPETLTLEERAPTPEGEWHQHLKIAKVGTTEYILEGNAEILPAAKPAAPAPKP